MYFFAGDRSKHEDSILKQHLSNSRLSDDESITKTDDMHFADKSPALPSVNERLCIYFIFCPN